MYVVVVGDICCYIRECFTNEQLMCGLVGDFSLGRDAWSNGLD